METKATVFITKDFKIVVLIPNGNCLLCVQTETENNVSYAVIRAAHEFRRSCYFFLTEELIFSALPLILSKRSAFLKKF